MDVDVVFPPKDLLEDTEACIFIVLCTNLFNDLTYIVVAESLAVNVIDKAVEAHSFHSTPQGSFTNGYIVFCKQRYDYHLVGLTKVEVFSYCFINYGLIRRAFIFLLQSILFDVSAETPD